SLSLLKLAMNRIKLPSKIVKMRIFYDSLPCYIDSKENIEYKIRIEETTDWAR
ncbi:22315_t:CDS:2, partial [Gigaspora margarita]